MSHHHHKQTKFALIRSQDDKGINSAAIKKIAKCQDVVTVASFREYRKRSKIRFRSTDEANWSEFDLSELFRLGYHVVDSFDSLVNWDIASEPYQEVFMFTDDANASFVSMTKPASMKFFPFMLDKTSYKELADVTEKLRQYKLLISPYRNSQSTRDFAIDNCGVSENCKSFLRSEPLRMESEIIGKIGDFFSTEIDVAKRIIFSNW